MEYTIDAKGRTLGRVAAEAAALLMGKNKTDFVRHKISGGNVRIINVSLAKINQKKMDEKKYIHYTGYPGGLRSRSMQKVTEKKGFGELFIIAVDGMLPKNKLRSKMLKNLKVIE